MYAIRSYYVDDQVAAGSEGAVRAEERVKLALHLLLHEDRLGFLVGLDVLGMARHEHAHEVPRDVIAQSDIDFLERTVLF